MTELLKTYQQIMEAMDVPGLSIPMTAVKFYRGDDKIPKAVLDHVPQGVSVTSCQAKKQASLGDAVCLTVDSIGCVAAAITFGLVDPEQETPLEGPRIYTDIMKDHAPEKNSFKPPSPKDFTDGSVYAFKDAGRREFALFGDSDCGRFKNLDTARKAIDEMTRITPANTKAVFLYSPDFSDTEITPDVIVFSVRPVELTRLIQAYQFVTGERVTSSMGGLRVVNSDLIVRPFLENKINVSTYCLGARIIAQYEGDRMGMGMPYSIFKIIARGMTESRTGYPFNMYPGAEE